MIRGDKAAAESGLTGERDAKNFHGTTLSLGGPSLVNLWDYRAGVDPQRTAGKKTISHAGWHALEIVRKDDTLKVSLDGAMEFEVNDLRHRRRVSPAIYLQGEGAELRIGHLKIEAL